MNQAFGHQLLNNFLTQAVNIKSAAGHKVYQLAVFHGVAFGIGAK